MRKKREFIEGAFYHVTSRTNDKIRVFENNLGRKIMLITLQDAKDKFNFKLTNFCVMPTHIHLLIKPEGSANLSSIMHWLKLQTAKRWNFTHGSTDHLWGHRYFARPIRDYTEYEHVMNYIDENPVKAGLAAAPNEWKASGAFYGYHGLELIDSASIFYAPSEYPADIFLLTEMPFAISCLFPPAQLDHVKRYYGVYAEKLCQLYDTILKIPLLKNMSNIVNHNAYLHYYTGTADYLIYGYDGQDTMYARVSMNVFPAETVYQEISLAKLLNNPYVKLDLSWKAL